MRARHEDELQYDYCAYRLNDRIITKAKLKGLIYKFKPGASAKRQVPKLLKGKSAKKAYRRRKVRLLKARAKAASEV